MATIYTLESEESTGSALIGGSPIGLLLALTKVSNTGYTNESENSTSFSLETENATTYSLESES